MKDNRTKSAVTLLLVLAATAAACILGFRQASGIKLGLDLAGGVSITYEADRESPTDQDMEDTMNKLRKRAELYSNEAMVYREGDNRINVDIPGVSDANQILRELGKPGSLQFCTGNYDKAGNLLDFEFNDVILTGADIRDAQAMRQQGQNGTSDSFVVVLYMNDEGKTKFAEATSRNVGRLIAIKYDGEIISAPVVQQVIPNGECSITGNFTIDTATTLASTIRLGALKLELTELRSNVVGALLGQQALRTSVRAGLVGFVIILFIMAAAYGICGLSAAIALFMYIGLAAIAIRQFGITMTLPGIAGVILSIGMAVDANVIIFTRIKEEIGLGTSVARAIESGFKKAFTAIFDGNMTTLLAAAVLHLAGSGTVRGFSHTLAIGIIISMFTALTITRLLVEAFYGLGISDARFYGKKKPVGKPTDFLSKSRIFTVAAAVIIAIGLGFMLRSKAATGDILNYSLDFRGGTSTNVTFNEDYTLEELSAQVAPAVVKATGDMSPQLSKVAGTREVIIRTRSLSLEEREKMNSALADGFGVDPELITAENISGSVSAEMKKDALTAVSLATFLMLLYIWVRFRNLSFALSAVTALAHDVAVTLAFYSVFGWSVGNTFIACMLTIVGYSINDTIVVFDRIRENLREYPQMELKTLANLSITETFSRSIMTSVTTFVMVFVLYVFGVSSVREFALPLMVGIVAGNISSICLAGPMWAWLTARGGEKAREKAMGIKEELVTEADAMAEHVSDREIEEEIERLNAMDGFMIEDDE